MNRNPPDSTPLLLVAIVVAALSARGCGTRDANPEPKPNPPAPVVTARETFDAYRRLMAEAWTDGAARVEAGELTSDRAAHDWIAERADLARKAARQPLHDREQATLGDGKWTAAGQAALWRQFATECQ